MESRESPVIALESSADQTVESEVELSPELNKQIEEESLAIVERKNQELTVKNITYEVNTFNLEKYLDVPTTDDFYYEGINKQLPIGTSNGLAFINDGSGSVLKIQFVRNTFGKKEGTLTFTGMLGDVMKESVEVVKMATFNFLDNKGIMNKE